MGFLLNELGTDGWIGRSKTLSVTICGIGRETNWKLCWNIQKGPEGEGIYRSTDTVGEFSVDWRQLGHVSKFEYLRFVQD